MSTGRRNDPRATPRVLCVAEPAAAWMAHLPAVVDCSVLAALLWAESAAADARERVRHRTLHAPALLSYEIANVARNKCRSGVPEAVARTGVEDYAQLHIERHAVEPAALFDIAQRLDLTVYDAAYVWLAAELRAPLITFDRKLGEAARRHLGALE